MIELLGYLAATLTTLSFLPQVMRAWRTRRTQDLSLPMYVLFTLGLAAWLAFGLLTHARPIVVANAATLVLAGSLLVLKLRHG